MSKHVSFPAAHLSAHEVGKRIQVITTTGAKIADTLTAISVRLEKSRTAGSSVEVYRPRIFLTFENVPADSYGTGAFEVDGDQFVKRIDEDA